MKTFLPIFKSSAKAQAFARFIASMAIITLTGWSALQAQTPTVAFVGVTRTDSPDGFAFVAGEALAGGTDIYFTDEEYRDICNAFHFDTLCEDVNDGEPYLVYTTPAGGLSAGEVVFVSETAANVFTVTGGGGSIVHSGGSFTLSASDVLFAFATSNPADPQDNVTDVYAALNLSAAFDGSVAIGDDPRVDYPNAVVTILNASNGEFDPALRTGPVTKADIEDVSKWNTSGANLPLSTVNFTGGIDLSSGCTPTLDGLNVTQCPSTPTGQFTIEADGELNGADSWYIKLVQNGETCGNFTASGGFAFTESFTQSFTLPDSDYVVFPIGDCITEQICYIFTPRELFGIPNFSLATTTYNEGDGVQTGLGGATPTGGVYSGPGVTDDGNGMTFSFDPAAAGVGNHSVTYTTGDNNDACSNLSASVTITVEACVQPVIMGVELISCPDNPDGDYTFQVNGSLNGATTWEWTFGTSTGEDCADLGSNNSGEQLTSSYSSAGFLRTYYVRAVGGCIDEPVCFAYVPAELAGAAALTLPNTSFCLDEAAQAGLGGGSPAGGTYSGPGVTDDGNGTTFSFDPSAAGAGTHTVSYTVNTGSVCGESSATVDVSVFASPTVTFASSLNTVSVDAGLQTSISGGSPAGGVYSGPGVTDEGNGMSFSFDPAVAGTGEVIVTYTFTNGNGCADNQSDVITVTDVELAGDICPDAIDINPLFDGPLNEALVSTTQDNTGYNPENDPGVGYECWFGDQPVLNNTIWYAFTGDGEKYGIRSIQCDTINPMTNTDTQFALYSGDCTTPVAVACNDDEDFDSQIYNSYLEIITEPGVEYLLMVDGYVAAADYAAIGTFCLEVTLLETVGVTNINDTELQVYPNPTTGMVQLPALLTERVEVFDATGRLLINQQSPGASIDLSAYQGGLYLLKLYTEEGVYSTKVIKN